MHEAQVPNTSLVCSNHREPRNLHEEKYRTRMGWQEVVLSSCLTSSRAPLSSASASPAAELKGRRPSSCAAGNINRQQRIKNMCGLTARRMGKGGEPRVPGKQGGRGAGGVGSRRRSRGGGGGGRPCRRRRRGRTGGGGLCCDGNKACVGGGGTEWWTNREFLI